MNGMNHFRLPLFIGFCCAAWPFTAAAGEPTDPTQLAREHAEKTIQDWKYGRNVLDEMREKELEAESQKMFQEFREMRERDEKKWRADELREKAMHERADRVFYLIVLVAIGTCSIVNLWKRRQKSVGERDSKYCG